MTDSFEWYEKEVHYKEAEHHGGEVYSVSIMTGSLVIPAYLPEDAKFYSVSRLKKEYTKYILAQDAGAKIDWQPTPTTKYKN